MNETFSKYVKKIKSPKILVAAGIIGILLIYVSSFFSGGSSKSDVQTQEFTQEEYRAALEQDVAEIVENITGDSSVTVMITLESGIKYNYVAASTGTSSDKTESQNKTSSQQTTEEYIIVKTADGGEEALLVTAEMPQVRGVAIVCQGGDNEAVSEKIKNTVMAALNITSKRIYIVGGTFNEKR